MPARTAPGTSDHAGLMASYSKAGWMSQSRVVVPCRWILSVVRLDQLARMLGTTWGPHATRDHERSTRMRTPRTSIRVRIPLLTYRNALALGWESRGRRFKSCQPDE